MNNFSTPILFIIFKRPDTTAQVFRQIRAVKPSKLFVAADGPRVDKEGEAVLCEKTRQVVLDNIDWDCEVHTLLRDDNLGCGLGPSSAISWFFDHVEEGIILEDDCLPSLSFFSYAAYCLDKYRNNLKIMHIGGNNFLGRKWGDASYFYSAYNHVWGWATWRRSWELYNYNLQALDESKLRSALGNYFPWSIRNSWFNYYKSLLERKINDRENRWDFWDYQWTFCIWLNQGLCVYPNVNLVSNIGFGPGATHTLDITNKFNSLASQELEAISSPHNIKRNKEADILTSQVVFKFKMKKLSQKYTSDIVSLSQKSKNRIRKLIPDYLKKAAKQVLRLDSTSHINIKNPEQIEIERIKSIPRYIPESTNLIKGNFRFVDSASFIFMYDEIFKKQIYDFRTTQERPYIIDCGANVGLSIVYFKDQYPNAEIVAFEPDPKVFGVLESNVGKLSDVKLVNRALWNTETTMSFFAEGADGGSFNSVSDNVERIEVLTDRLRSYLDKKVDFLKIDIEGAELTVLEDSEDKLHLVQNMFIEYHSFVEKEQELAKVLGILERNQFRYHINSPGLTSGRPFVKRNTYNGMDMQLNIYGFKQ
ncbi:FkbM family methyltransferase [Pontibacter pudoricolor]|uniref:FkbM family methyltransferase n=1 Tax=Pontibacter pudoricolor TaxID=2694930 RepID=UPI001391FC54|nr:FkbM family methyltransferase [Pontibacter pudoricolor]